MDSKTGLGQTLEEHTLMNGDVLLDDVYIEAMNRKKESQITTCDCDDIDLLGSDFLLGGEVVARMDDYGWTVLGKFLGIPVPYLLKLPQELKNVNSQYWLGQKSGKQVKVQVRDSRLVDVSAAESIEHVDVFDILNNQIIEGHVLATVQQTNSTVYDIYSPIETYRAGGRSYYGGIRAVVKDGLNAPDIVPIFVDIDSCAVIECSTFMNQSSIRGLSYADVLKVIQSSVSIALSALPTLFKTYEQLSTEQVSDPRRRIALYCREHNLPERVSAYVLNQYDTMRMSGTTYGDIISLFGGMGFVEEVKQASARKMQKLAGYIVVRAHSERRCSACDSKLLDE